MNTSFNNTKLVLFILLLFFNFNSTIGQKLRTITIKTDTAYDASSPSSTGENETKMIVFITNERSVSDSKISMIYTFKEGWMDGIYMAFYPSSNLPRYKGTYEKGKKVGVWYYWSKEGMLQKTETWKNDKMINTIQYSPALVHIFRARNPK